MADTYWDHSSRREIKRLIDLGDAGAILDELQQGSTEWDDAREALDHLVRGSRPEVERLRAELADTVGEARSDIAGLESLARRYRTAWESARRGRRSARLLNRELVRSMEMLRAELTTVRIQRDNARTEVGHLNVLARDLNSLVEELRADWKRVDQERLDLRDERDRLADEKAKLSATIAAFPDANNAANIAQARRQRDALAEQVKHVRGYHRLHSCDGNPADCMCADDVAEQGGPVCAHCRQAWPCITAVLLDRAPDGTEGDQ